MELKAEMDDGLGSLELADGRIVKLDYKVLLDNISDGVYFTDRQRTVMYWNKTAERITGYSAAEVLGHHCHDKILNHVNEQGESLCLAMCPLACTIKDCQPRQAHVFLHHKLGHRVPVYMRTMPLFDENDGVIGAAEFFTDTVANPSLQRRVRELEQLALLDPLTQLPNRRYIEPEIDARFNEMKRMGLTFGLLFMDIDQFKKFNDTYGHDTGDKALQTVAATLKAATRPFDLVGRWGGEEFLGVIRNVDIARLSEIGNRLRLLVANSWVDYKQNQLRVTLSVGATLAKADDTRQSLIERSDRLMYQSKNRTGNWLTIG
jgi:diguanylate cyclase (GGDEF)-like protein/PAS domain S-box-containing protein